MERRPILSNMGTGLKAASILAIVVCFSPFSTTIAADSKSALDTINQQKVAGAADPEKRDLWRSEPGAVDAWNQHNLEGYLDTFSTHSDSLVVVVEGETVRGWDLFSKSFAHWISEPERNGQSNFRSSPSSNVVERPWGWSCTWDTVSFPKKKEFGTSTIVMKKLPEGWRDRFHAYQLC